MSTNTSNPSNNNTQEPLLKQRLAIYREDLKRGLDLIVKQEALQVVYNSTEQATCVPVKSVHKLLDAFAVTLDNDLLTPSNYALEVLKDLAVHLKKKLPELSLVSNFSDPEWVVGIHKDHETIDTVLNDLLTPSKVDANNYVLKVFHKTHQMLLQTHLTQTKEMGSLKERLTQTEKELDLYKQRERELSAVLAKDTNPSAWNMRKKVNVYRSI